MSVLGKLSEIFLKPDGVEKMNGFEDQLATINSSDLPKEVKEELINSLKGLEDRERNTEKERREELAKALKVESKQRKIKNIESIEQEQYKEEEQDRDNL